MLKIWNSIQDGYRWVVVRIAEYPQTTFWSGVVIFVAYAIWRR